VEANVTRAACLFLLSTLLVGPSSWAQSGRVHLVRSTSGGKGAESNGRFVFEDPRSSFVAGQDRQVLVLFEWQGPPGLHRCEGVWKDPTGRVVFTSQAEIQARGPRFAVYWGLSLPDSVTTGLWVLEARVDGEPAGMHAFQIQSDSLQAAAPAAAQRRPLPVAELYQRGQDATLTLQVIGADGRQLGVASGYFATPDLVATSLEAINAARIVRLVRPGVPPVESGQLASWNRRNDWAFVPFPNASGRVVERGPKPVVGDRCFFLDTQGEQGRVIVETSVVGISGDGVLTLSHGPSDAALGAPLLNEFGEIVGALAGSGIVGASRFDLLPAGGGGLVRGMEGRVRPLPFPPDPAAATRSFAALDREGFFVRPVVRTPHFVQGTLGTGVTKKNGFPIATDQRYRFSRQEGQALVFVTWSPAKKENTTSHFELFDVENRKLGATDPKPANCARASRSSSIGSWSWPPSTLGCIGSTC
jgi:hypothetical protein